MAKDNGKEPAKEIAKQAPLPAFMRKDAGRGTEGLTTKDIEMPRIKLLQGLSPELEQYNNVKSGEFFHTIAEKSLGKELEMVPLHISKRYVLWNPRWDGGGILARADDAVHWQPPKGSFRVHTDKSKKPESEVTWTLAPTVPESGLAEWGTFDPKDPGSQPAATEAFVIVVNLVKHPELSPVALLLQRTALTPAKKLNAKLKLSGSPIFGLRFNMTSFVDHRQPGDFNNYVFEMLGYVEDEAYYEHCRELYENFSKSGVQVRDMEGAQDEGGSGGGGGGPREDVSGEKKF